MTCVVALKASTGRILMGADSAGVGGYSLQHRADRKIYKNGDCLLGFTSSFRMGQLLGYSLEVPKFYLQDYSGFDIDRAVEKFMVTKFIDAVRTCLKNGGFATKDKEAEAGGCFLVAFCGRIFQIDSDYQVAMHFQDYAAVGCGFDLALGSLFTSDNIVTDPHERVRLALQAAEKFSAGVRGPFIIEELVW